MAYEPILQVALEYKPRCSLPGINGSHIEHVYTVHKLWGRVADKLFEIVVSWEILIFSSTIFINTQ